MLEEGTLGCLRSDVIHSGGGGESDSTVYKLFLAFSTVFRPLLYQRTVGVVVPVDTNLCASMHGRCMDQCRGWGKDLWWWPTLVPQLRTYPW